MHEMEVESTQGDIYILSCPVCQRRVSLRLDPYEKKVLFSGNFRATHQSTLPDLLPSASEVADRLLKEIGF